MRRGFIAGAVVAAVVALAGASLGWLASGRPATAAPARAPAQQGVNASGIVTTGSGTCFPDAVLVDCNGNVTQQLKGPGGASFFAPFYNRWVDVNASSQTCAGGTYLQVVTIQPATSPCGGGGQPTPPGPTATPPQPPGPTITPGASINLALGRPVQASSSQAGFPPENAVDGNPASYWASNPGRQPYYPAQNIQWIYVDLGSPQRMERMRLLWNAQRHPRSYGVYMHHDYCRGWCYLGSTNYADGGEDIWTAQGTIEGQYFMLWLVNPYLMGGAYELQEWEITGPGGAPVTANNVALGRPATAYSQAAGAEAGKATDGDLASEWRSGTGLPTWLYVDLGTATEVDRAILRWSAGAHGTRYVLYAWDDRLWPARWVPIYSRTNGAGGDETLTFWAVRTRYLMLYVTSGAAPDVGLRELEVYNRVNAMPPGGPPAPPRPPTPFMLFEGDPGRTTGRLTGRPNVVPKGVTIQPPAVLRQSLDALGLSGLDAMDGIDGVAMPDPRPSANRGPRD